MKKATLMTTMAAAAASIGIPLEFEPRSKHISAPHWKETQSEEDRSKALQKAKAKRERKARLKRGV